jgi:hypothetical protein
VAALIPSSLGNPPSILSHPLAKTFSAPIPALGQSLSSVSLFNSIPRASSPMATSQTLPILPSISHIPASIYTNGSQAGLESDRAVDSDSSDEEEEEVIAPMRKRSGASKRHPLSRGGGNGVNSSGSNGSESDDDDN